MHNPSMPADSTLKGAIPHGSTSDAQAPGLRERKKARTRATIRRQAMRLFLEQGYAQTSVEQIAEAAEVSPSTFFRYFPTKEEVVLADDIDPILLRVLAEQPADLPPLTAIRHAITTAFGQLSQEDISRELERQRLMYAVPELQQAVMMSLYRSIDMIANAVAARLGRPPEDFEVRVFAGAVAGAVIGGAAGPTGGIDKAIRAIEFLDDGLPLTR
jgi:AcrR family transcriptional regulator